MELWQLPVAILLGILIGWVTAGMGLTFLMRFAYGLMNMGEIKLAKWKQDICPVHKIKRAKGFCHACSIEKVRGTDLD